MLYPPRPGNISIPAVIAGNTLQNDDTSISAIDSGFDGSLVMKTQNTLALVINQQQRVSINSQSTEAMLTVNTNQAILPASRLSYQDRFYYDTRISMDGNVIITPNCDDLILDPLLTTMFKKNVDIVDHDGMTTGLRLNGISITASASEINYVDVPAGIAQPSKALVLNSSKNITGINALTASSLTGTLTAGPQLGITEIDTLNVKTQLSISGVPFLLNPSMLECLDVTTPGIAQGNKALILNSGRNISAINNLSASTLTGTILTANQPNITMVGALGSLTVNGQSTLNRLIINSSGTAIRINYNDTIFSELSVDSSGNFIINASSTTKISSNYFTIVSHDGIDKGLVLGNTLVRANAYQLNYNVVTPGIASAEKTLVLNSAKSITGVNLLGATSLSGTVLTNIQPFINTLTTLNITNHNSGTTGLSLNGTLVTASANQINYVNVTQGAAVASKALIIDANRSINNINTIGAESLLGVIKTEYQPFINSVNTLAITQHNGASGLILGSTLVTASANQLNYTNVSEGIASAGKALVLNNSKNISGINTLNANLLGGTILTEYQPNITSVNTLDITLHNSLTTGLKLNGTLITSTANQLNRVNTSPGTAEPGKALIVNNTKSITGISTLVANFLGGTLTTEFQPLVTAVKVLDIADHNGATTGLSLGGILVKIGANQLNTLDIIPGTALGGKALILNAQGEISGITSLSSSNIIGTLKTSNQPFITTLNTLNITSHNGTTGLSLNGTLVNASAEQLNRVNVDEGVAAPSKALVLSSNKTIIGIASLSSSQLFGVLNTPIQPYIASVNTLNIVSHNGSTTGLALNGTLVTSSAEQINYLNTTTGTAFANKAVILNNNSSFSGINSLKVNTLEGTIVTPSQPNITSVNVLNIANHNGGSDGLRLKGSLVNTTAAQLNYNVVVPGVASSLHSLVTNEFNSIGGINAFNATKIVAEQLQLTGVIANFNVGGIIIKTYSFTNLVGRIVDIQLLQNISFTNFQPANLVNTFSSEIIGYIMPRYSEIHTFFATCNDRIRLWVNGVLILHSWSSATGVRTSTPIFLNADQWVPIYIQYQVDSSASQLNLEWSSTSNGKTPIPSSRLAWDNNPPPNDLGRYTQNALTIYNSSTANANTAKFTVDTGGDLTIDASGNDISLGAQDNLNIVSHDGVTRGLMLGGVLVKPTAYEINYLKVSPGIVSPSQALVADASKSITGLNSIGATSINCANLTAAAFTINNLSLSGPLNNYNVGNLLVRQFTGADLTGRVVNVSTIEDINLNNYDPKELNTNFSLDIIGYINPAYTETYKFYAIANDRVRIWVNNVLILNVWDLSSGLEYTSESISLVANQWVPIYIQFQNVVGNSALQVRWSSTSLAKSFIESSKMAWDNTNFKVPKSVSAADSITVFSSQSGLTDIQSGTISLTSNGNLSLSSKSGLVSIANANDFNISSHNGTRGLQLAGAIVTATAAEINRLSGVQPGTLISGKVIIADSTKSISGLTSITSDVFIGSITGPQPGITRIGTLSSTLNITSDIIINTASSVLRLANESGISFIQCGATTTANSASDLFIGNYQSTTATSSRKFMIKANGSVGIQTNTPNRALSVNGSGAAYAMRLMYNSALGEELNFTDMGTNLSGNMIIAPTGTATSFISDLKIGKGIIQANINVSSNGVMRLDSSCVQIGNATSTAMPLEVGSADFTLTSTIGYLNSDGSTGKCTTTPTTYSMRTSSSIIVNGTVCVTSDKRLKDHIKTLDLDQCKTFIVNSNPVSFVEKKRLNKLRYGLIAQDVYKSNFKQLVDTFPQPGLAKEEEEDGFVSPANQAMNVSYTEIIPILMATIKDLYKKNEALELKLEELYKHNGLFYDS